MYFVGGPLASDYHGIPPFAAYSGINVYLTHNYSLTDEVSDCTHEAG